MDLEDIVEDWLRKNEYDGLYSKSNSCDCEIDDLFPCFLEDLSCKPWKRADGESKPPIRKAEVLQFRINK